jgi:hypothetical protein
MDDKFLYSMFCRNVGSGPVARFMMENFGHDKYNELYPSHKIKTDNFMKDILGRTDSRDLVREMVGGTHKREAETLYWTTADVTEMNDLENQIQNGRITMFDMSALCLPFDDDIKIARRGC